MLAEIDQQIQTLIREVGERTKAAMQADFTIDEKTSPHDLVTTVDKQNEQIINQRLREIDPTAQIISEEGFGDQVHDIHGHVWIVDPVDGTMNFIMERENFAIMLALYIDGQPTLGYILDVMKGLLYHGGPALGVWEDDHQLSTPLNRGLRDGLIDVSSRILMNDLHHAQTAAKAARSIRVFGSAGISMTQLITGRTGAYITNLKPWDLAPGRVLAEAQGLVVKRIDEQPIDMLSSNFVLVATPKAAKDIMELIN
ncbi:Putative inositol-phosphate phosphatase [Limosilactobacillus gastricus PS3]|uniref:Putative inositol-phosphate phosphatase n=1 Tax=Limosilactobacillus gastricus PS3 TaxID=1144300 RepID=H4GL56_9LACO|nr:inositol monophosphatase family protein [Limosilactobacillus gastricus]EHS84686.1 Putative inositol-phosphate phosphatase [Limosilactobacillus gastricus PS3]